MRVVDHLFAKKAHHQSGRQQFGTRCRKPAATTQTADATMRPNRPERRLTTMISMECDTHLAGCTSDTTSDTSYPARAKLKHSFQKIRVSSARWPDDRWITFMRLGGSGACIRKGTQSMCLNAFYTTCTVAKKTIDSDREERCCRPLSCSPHFSLARRKRAGLPCYSHADGDTNSDWIAPSPEPIFRKSRRRGYKYNSGLASGPHRHPTIEHVASSTVAAK